MTPTERACTSANLIARLLREPLLQFLALGAMLFALYGFVGKRSPEAIETIVVSASRLANLADGFARTWQRPPSEEEKKGLVEDYIREEVFYRAGKDLGLDLDDVVVRRRVRQKMELLAEEVSTPEPTEEQLRAYFDSNPERFRTESRLSFRQIFLSNTGHGQTIEADVKRVSAALAAGVEGDEAALGDRLPFEQEYRSMTLRDLTRTFGDSFAKAIFTVEKGGWQGPITSSYGRHFVLIEQRSDGTLPSFEMVKPQVVRQWSVAQRTEAEQKLYRSLRDHYQVVVESAPAPEAAARP